MYGRESGSIACGLCRPLYRKVAMDRARFHGVPFMALTASATPNMINDIRAVMRSDEMAGSISVFQSPCFRSNLYISVHGKARGLAADRQLYELLSGYLGGCAIVYVQRKKETEKLCNVLNKVGVQAKPFHAGLCSRLKEETLAWFKSGVPCIVIATIAFGMGIDRSDVRLVVHFCMPRDIVSYFQEIGRAGRDGKRADCVLFYAAEDVLYLENQIYKERGGVMKLCELKAMESWCIQFQMCRHVQLIRRFQEPNMTSCSFMCDICARNA